MRQGQIGHPGKEQQTTLPDYLAPGLDIVFVGINPGAYSAQVGHYFATPRNRFWAAVKAAGLIEPTLGPETDHRILEYGMGFTDVVKRPSASASQITAAEFRQGAPVLKDKLLRYQPRIACFHGMTAFSSFARYALSQRGPFSLGLQPFTLGETLLFVVPNPSPANAAFSLDTLVSWYRELKVLREQVASP